MQIELNHFLVSSFETIIQKKEKKCILYCDFNVANIIYEQNLKVPQDFIMYPDSNLMHVILKWFYGLKIDKIVSTDLQDHIINLCNEKQLKLYLFGDKEELLVIIKRNFLINFQNISIVGYRDGYNCDTLEVIHDIIECRPDILLLGLGAGRQEKWLVDNYTKLPPIISFSVGGYFQFLSKTKKRAPHLFRKLQLEWFYRIITEFNTIWKKYSIDAIKFLYRVFSKKIEFIIITNG